MANKDKLVATAQKFLVKGQVAKAIGEYQKLVDAFPKDFRSRQKLAELLSRDRRNEDALGHYELVAKHYSDTGFYLKAIAVYKQMQRLEPSRVDIYHCLAKLSEKQGLLGNALTEYRNLMSFYEENDMYSEAIDVLFKMAELDPDNLNIFTKLIETYQKSHRDDEAYQQFTAIIDKLDEEGNSAQIVKLYDRFLGICPEETAAWLPYADALIATQHPDKAIPVLQQLLKHVPDDTDVMVRLADCYLLIDDLDNARLTLQHLARMHPDDLDLKDKMIRVCLREEEFERARDHLEASKKKFLEAGRQGDVRAYYEQLSQALPDDPVVARALASLGGLAVEESLPEPSAESVDPLETDTVEDLSINMSDGELADAFKETKTIGETSDDHVAEDFSSEGFELELELDLDLEGPSHADPSTGLLDKTSGRQPEAIQPEEMSGSATDDGAAMEIEIDLDDFNDFGVDLDDPDESVASDDAEATEEVLEGLEVVDESEIDEPIEELEEIVEQDPVDSLPAEEPTERVSEPGRPDHAMARDIQNELDEVEFYLHQRLYDKAENVLQTLLDQSPDDPLLREKLSAVNQLEATATSDEAADFSEFISKLDDEELFDDSNFLADVPEGSSAGEMTQRLASELDSEDTESHFNLGIAYKEMGLFDDAIREFEHASEDTDRRIDCLTLKGQCYLEQGEFDLAEKDFQDALSQDALNEEARMTIHYELGLLYQQSGRPLDAMEHFRVVAANDLFFRSVGEKLEALRKDLGLRDEDDSTNGPQGNRDKVSYL
ncbi:MAG: tetratricopeptide repeat protein [Deltaproteobacteria bacterium]|nr:tetratricopeptide repeat protein [Deltaproteobacteria bacterium]